MKVCIVRLVPYALSFVVALVISGSVLADYCPIYYVGSWNGMHYHYCRKRNECEYPLYYVVADRDRHQTATCYECDDPIGGNPGKKIEDDPPVADPNETDLLGFHLKNGGIEKFVPVHTGTKPGNEPGAGPAGGEGQFFSSGVNLRVARDETVRVKLDDGSMFFFRILTIKSKIDGETAIARIGQQLEEDPGEDAFDGTRKKELGGVGSKHWKIAIEDQPGKYRYFYVILKKK